MKLKLYNVCDTAGFNFIVEVDNYIVLCLRR